MKKAIKNLDKQLLLLTIILFAVGLLMIFSASNVTAYMSQGKSIYKYFIKQGLILVLGLLIALVVICIPTSKYSKLSRISMIVGIISLGLLPYFGVEVNQAKSWFDLKLMYIQPSEFVKIISIVWLAYYYDKNEDKLDTYSGSLFPLGIILLNAFFIFFQPDLGTTIIYCCICFSIFWISHVDKKIKQKIFLSIGCIVLCGLFIVFTPGQSLLEERQLKRLTEFKNPCDKLLSSGNQVCNSYIAINNGGLKGVGLGNSTQKYGYLPEPYTDFIFAIIVEELGLFRGLLIIGGFIYVLYRILKIGRNSQNNMGTMICFGVAMYITIHIVVNLMGLFGLMPMTGVPLPFMSYGGSFTLCLIISIAIVQRINIENNLAKEIEIKRIKNKK